MEMYYEAVKHLGSLLDMCEHDKERQFCPKCHRPSGAEKALADVECDGEPAREQTAEA